MNRTSLLQERLGVERTLIGFINKLDSRHTLSGLNSTTIHAWMEDMNQARHDAKSVRQVGDALIEIVGRLKLDADKSRVVFDELATLGNADEELIRLREIVATTGLCSS